MEKYLLIEMKVVTSVPSGARAFFPLPEDRNDMKAAISSWQTVLGSIITEAINTDAEIQAVIQGEKRS